jgi:hypothetical protein
MVYGDNFGLFGEIAAEFELGRNLSCAQSSQSTENRFDSLGFRAEDRFLKHPVTTLFVKLRQGKLCY